jgi:hypothetical protein
MPYVCGNIAEFSEERRLLREHTFPKLREHLGKANVHFSPVQIEWNEAGEPYLKSGNLLRLLFTNISQSAPFFICLVGFKYGTYLNKSEEDANNQETNSAQTPVEMKSARNWLEKNVLVASQTGYGRFFRQTNSTNSMLEHQINYALANEANYPYYRFYFRQYEYLEEKFLSLSIEEKKRAIREYEAEDETCEMRLRELKMKIAKRGIVIRYYKSLEELNRLVAQDTNEIVQGRQMGIIIY